MVTSIDEARSLHLFLVSKYILHRCDLFTRHNLDQVSTVFAARDAGNVVFDVRQKDRVLTAEDHACVAQIEINRHVLGIKQKVVVRCLQYVVALRSHLLLLEIDQVRHIRVELVHLSYC